MTMPAMCVQGADEADSGCRLLKGGRVIVESVGKGHHFSGEYDRLVALILRTIGSGGR
jgi:type IV secretory pathway VirJ component